MEVQAHPNNRLVYTSEAYDQNLGDSIPFVRAKTGSATPEYALGKALLIALQITCDLLEMGCCYAEYWDNPLH